MKGIVFTELIDHAEARFGIGVVDRAIAAAELPSHGAYTAVGTYPVDEFVALLDELAAATGEPASRLLTAFGEHLFIRFATLFPRFFTGVDSALTFLESVDGVVHLAVRKLYPDAELPQFDCERVAADRLRMTYRSERPLADLAEGLIRGCARHFTTDIEIVRQSLPADSGNSIRFELTCLAKAPQTTS